MSKSKESAIAEVRKRIVPVSEATPYARVLLYGLNGRRKTRTAATAPSHLIIDVDEEGSRSVKNYPGVEVFPAKSWEDVVWAYWYLRAGKHKHKSFSIDTVTNMQMVCMTHVLKEGADRDPMRDPAMPGWKDYGKVNALMKKYLLFYRNLPLHMILIAQEKSVDNDETGETEHVPDLSPGSRGTAMACVDFIGRMYVKEVRTTKNKKEVKGWEPRMLIGPHENYITKDRSGILPRIIRNPTMSQIIEAANHIQEDE